MLLLNDHSTLGNGMGVVFCICCDSVIPGKTHSFHKLKKESISNCQPCQHIWAVESQAVFCLAGWLTSAAVKLQAKCSLPWLSILFHRISREDVSTLPAGEGLRHCQSLLI